MKVHNSLLSTTLLFLSLLSIGGCATVFSPSRDDISFTSYPEGAEVWLDGKKIGRTPLVHRFDRRTFHTKRMTVRAPGYQPQSFPLSKSLNRVAILNLTLWPSWITDALSGSMIEYIPNSYFIELEPRQQTQGRERSLNRSLLREQRRYLLTNYESLLKDIARGHGQHLQTYWKITVSDHLSYDEYLELVVHEKPDLLAHQTPLELQDRLAQLTKDSL